MNSYTSLRRTALSAYCLLSLLACRLAHGQFVAFNDHAPGTVGVTTHPNATTWNIFDNPPGASGPLKDINTGLDLPVTVTITRMGSVNSAPTSGNPDTGTPLYNTFNGYVDFQGAGNADAVAQVTGTATVTYTFTGLNPNRSYNFRGSAVRGGSGGNYGQRWSLIQLDGAISFASAHTVGCLTTGFAANQVAVNTGINFDGDMADWENIVPDKSGSFSVTTTQYTGPIPAGGTASGPYCYAVSGFRLEELAADTPVSITREPASTTVGELAPASFTIAVAGNPPPTVQWLRNNSPISGATSVAYTIPMATLADSGSLFKVVAQNMVSNLTFFATSTAATLTVVADTNPPVLLGAQALGLDQVQVTFSERITPATATNRANYSITTASGTLSILSATLDVTQTNLILAVATMADSSICTLHVSKLADQSAARNIIAPNSQTTFVVSTYTPVSIGNSVPPGNQTAAGNGYNISGGGSGIGGAGDQGQFSYQLRAGDFDVKVRLDSLGLADAWSQAGLMAREDLNAGARSAAVLATPTISGTFFESRTATNGAAANSGSFPVNYPNTWLRLKRAGNALTGFASLDGLNWAQLGTASMTLPGSLYLGFAVSSHNTNQLTTAAFRDFSPVTGVGANPPPQLEPLGQCSRRTSLVISEIMYHPIRSNLAFVEIFNSRGEPQDLSGYQLAGAIDYRFPTGTTLPGGGFVVVAKSPLELENAYGITGVFGPYTNNLPNGGGTVRLLNQAGAVFLEVNYSDREPWPVAADGAGHSLVLARPSYGEDNPLAWAGSDAIGGSPGKLDPYTPDPLRSLVINEFLAHTDDPEVDYIELYNHSLDPVDISGCILTDDPTTNKFVIPSGTVIAPGDFVYYAQSTMNFSLNAAGESISFVNPSQTRILDAVRFEGQENGVATGRYPDGAEQFYRLNSKTPGNPNSGLRSRDVVINEIMYAPVSLDEDEQYVELYNQGTKAVNMSGWKFVSGINFTFPPNIVLSPGGYLVVARNAARLLTTYPNLNAGNLVGDFGGKLARNGERLALAMPDSIIATNSSGTVTTNKIQIIVDEVTYHPGGRWPQWASGGGSSLELIDPRSDSRLAANWADSDETHKAPWTQISATGTIDNGRTASIQADQLQVLLQGPGECLIDNVQVLDPSGNNRISNSTFESGAGGWTAEGTESRSGLETSEGFQSARSYHLRAADRGDNQINRVRTPLSSAFAVGTQGVTIKAAVRWLKGHPEVLLRLRGNWLECVGEMALPVRPGTPGSRNSRFAANAPPTLIEVRHAPVLPQASQPIVVTAYASDPDGVGSVQLKYRLDPSTSYSLLPMNDGGTNGDEIASDGIYSVTIPGQPTGTMVVFYLQASDQATTPASATFPSDAPTRECLVRVGESQPTGNFPVYRVWMTQATLNTWSSRNKLDNTPNDVTFVLGKERVVYNTSALYAGSPHIAPGYCGPTCSRCAYSITFPADDLFLGEQNLVLDWPGGHGNETTAMMEEMGYWIADRINLPYSHRYIIRLHVNGVTDDARSTVFEAVMQPGGAFINAWSPEDPDGEFFKIDQAFEFNDSGGNMTSPGPLLQNFTTTGGVKKREAYRWNFSYRAGDRVNDYTDIFSLVDALNAPRPEPYTAGTEALVDVEEWMGIFATEHIIVNFDAYGHTIGKNMYAFLPSQGKWQLYMFDLDWLMLTALNFRSDYGPSTAPLFNAEDPTITRMYGHPPFLRAYWRAVERAVNGPLDPAQCNPVMDAKYRSLIANGVSWCDGQRLTAPTALKNWFSQRRTALQAQLANVSAPLAIGSVVVTDNVARITGTAPIAAQTLWFNGADYPLTWTSVSNWTATVALKPGTNKLSVVGIDLQGLPVPGASNSVVAYYSGNWPAPAGQVVISEIMYNPIADDAQFVEIYNTSSNLSFDLSGWEFRGLAYTFPLGSLIGPNQFLILAANSSGYAAAYGATNVVFDIFRGTLQTDGETLSLVIPGTNAATDQIVSKVRYGSAAPWPGEPNGAGSSLQLVDPRQDNWRVGNWAAALINLKAATPGTTNSVNAVLPPFPPLWINEVQADNLTGITNRAGARVPWLEVYNPTTNLVSLNGLYLANSYTNPTAWAFPAGTSIGPGQFKVVFADGQTNLSTAIEWHTSFSLLSGGGSVLLSRLYDNSPQVLDYLDYTNLTINHSYGSFPDGQSFTRQEFTYVSPAATNNGSSAPLNVRINELMAGNTHTVANPVDGKFSDWFELYNYGSTTAELGGYYLTDNLTNQFKFQIPHGYSIPPHEFLLVWADGKPTNGTPDLHISFKLSKSGEELGLYGADGVAVDYISYPAQVDDVSQGRFPDGATAFHFMPIATPRTNNVIPNSPPKLLPIGDRTVTLGQTVAFTVSASDPDQPPQTLTFNLGANAPMGATINPLNGLFVWTPTSAPSTISVTVLVKDDGNPALSAAESFALTVFLPPQLTGATVNGNQLSLSWTSLEGQSYQLEYTDDLAAQSWQVIGGPVTGTGANLTITTDTTLSDQQFYRLRLLP